MRLQLTKPLVVFDLETTGLDLVNDRIIQISYIKVCPDDAEGEEQRKSIFINPGKPIPVFVQELTGITEEMVKDAPTFKQIAKNLAETFTGCDFAGFNSNRFDVPMLAEATYRVLQGQLDKYNPDTVEEESLALPNDMNVLNEESKMNDFVDFAGRIVWQDMKGTDGKPLLDANGKPRRQEVFNFGKYKGWAVTDVLHRDAGYYSWMLSSEFTLNTKQVLTRIRLREAKLNMNN